MKIINCSLYSLFVLSIIILLSCKKTNPNVFVNGEAKVKVVNAVATEIDQDVYIDHTKLTEKALAFGETSPYVKIPSGSNHISFVNSPSGSTDTTFNFTSSISYTVFLVSDRNGKREILSYENNLSSGELDKVKIKLINLSPYFNAGLNVSVQAGIQFVNNLAYKQASNYFTVNAGTNLRYTIAGSGNVKTIDGGELVPGNTYTIWFSGATAATLDAHILSNK